MGPRRMTDKMDRNWNLIKVKEDKRKIRQGTHLASASPGGVFIGIAAVDIEPGTVFTIDMQKGPNQFIWPSDGKEIIITAETVEEPTTKLLKEKE